MTIALSPGPRLDDLIQTESVIVCVGSGGVGKTTTSAAVALKAAQLGRTVCVLTIDPARRLATAMGLPALGNTATRVGDLPLWAMTLDAKQTWDDLVRRFAPTPAQAERIFANHYYQQISSSLAGSHEFMAMEKLYELHESAAYELLVLDTPPTRHALDFLEAPRKMMGFMDEGVLRLLTTPTRMAGRLGFGMLKSSTALMFGMLQRITGFEVLDDISDFVGSFSGMHAGFHDRAGKVEAYLRSPRSRFVLVTSPDPRTVEDAIFFFRKLREASMPFGGFVVNRVRVDALRTAEAVTEWERLRASPSELTENSALAGRLLENFEAYQALAEADGLQIRRLLQSCPGLHFWRTIPELDRDVHDLAGLERINQHLFEG
jgi:anion-transporting  ArsA/GET3 family ATPase